MVSTLNLFNKNVADIKIMLTKFNDISINNDNEQKKNTAKNLMTESGISESIINMSNTTAACFTSSFNDFFKSHQNKQKQCLLSMVTFKSNNPKSCGILETDDKLKGTEPLNKSLEHLDIIKKDTISIFEKILLNQ